MKSNDLREYAALEPIKRRQHTLESGVALALAELWDATNCLLEITADCLATGVISADLEPADERARRAIERLEKC